ncbi:protein kinase [Nonomuraea sp. NPDC049400]|uniref:protein kinase domain-containing protein n=1 Tax=Nonomuraea sp. NPDC049400 TaxID=3364352 RepID=UPI003790D4F9
MPSFTPLMPGDPAELAGLELLGKLGEGGQGVVYLAQTPMGIYAAIKWLRIDRSDDGKSVERFLREAEVAQRVAPFCTAAVLSTGVEHGRPYIMSEFVEGPSLGQAVRDEGPRTGTELDRLAIGTATALAAIHRANVVHRDFKPGNVIIAAGGPRVIDFGIARELDPATMTSSTQIGTPAYMSPEQILGHAVGPATDMFSWAATIVFASCGRAPFGSDGTHAVMSRVLRHQPDLGSLGGPLRDVVLQCLAKDPAQRPTAEQVIMRLLTQPVPSSHILQAGTEAATTGFAPDVMHAVPDVRQQQLQRPQEPQKPRKKIRRPVIIIAAAAAVLVLAGVPVVVALRNNLNTTAHPATTTPAPKETTQAPKTTAPTVPEKKQLPGGSITLYELPSDPITLTAYQLFNKNKDNYARQSLRGAFDKYAGNLDTMVSPDGRYVAGRHEEYTSDDYDSVLITDRQAGSSFRVKTVRAPLTSTIRSWSKDGSRILLNIDKQVKDGQGKEKWLSLGFAIVDVAQAKVKVVNVADESIRGSDFGWDGEQKGVVSFYGKDKGLRFFDASGKLTRDMPGVGSLSVGELNLFSPSGKMFVTDCPDGDDGDTCIWNSATGKQVRTFTSDCDTVLGWYDETHLYCWELDNGTNDEIQVVGFNGKLVRKLMEVPDELDLSTYFTINPARGS